jgi:hypothetical protein
VGRSDDGRNLLQPVDARTVTECMEQLQEGYIASVAATAGCLMEPVRRDLYGVDARLIRPYPPPQEETTLGVQLKSTTKIRPDMTKETFSYQIKKRQYFDQLSEPRTTMKIVLVVMAVHREQPSWTKGDHDYLRLYYCCYWRSLEGEQVPADVAAPTVKIPTRNVFDAPALASILDRIKRGESLND